MDNQQELTELSAAQEISNQPIESEEQKEHQSPVEISAFDVQSDNDPTVENENTPQIADSQGPLDEAGEGEDEEPEEENSDNDDLSQEYNEEEEKVEFTDRGCNHYKRNCQLHCHQYDQYFTCRFCHDEFWDSNIKEVEKHHYIDRFNVQKIKCLVCDATQVGSILATV